MPKLNPLEVEIESTDFDGAGLQIEKLEGREHISELFQFDLTVVMRGGGELPSGAIPGASLTLLMSRTNASNEVELRRIHGAIQSVRDRLDANRQHRTYVLRVVPRLSALRLVVTQELFLSSTVVDIIKKKLDLHDLAGEQLVFHTEDWPSRELVVQYQESDFAFVSRLAEHLGISFVFHHPEKGPECVIFTDDPAHQGIADAIAEVHYRADGEHSDVFALEVEREQYPSIFVAQDYNYRRPLTDIAAVHALKDGGNGGGVIEYGTHHKTKEEGERVAKVRAEEYAAAAETYFGKSALFTLTAGACPALVDHPSVDGERLLIVEVNHTATFGTSDSAVAGYSNSFRAVSAGRRYRPPRATRKPRISGLVTGNIALGPNGQIGGRAQIDEEGRYTVQLHFDTVTHEGQERASHPIRMAQPFAGPNHGFHFPLRPGTEVVVAFLDGDPDRPIIVGSVPNATNRSSVTVQNSNANRIESATGIVLQFSENK